MIANIFVYFIIFPVKTLEIFGIFWQNCYTQAMYDEQTRINAALSYFFLGPLFLLARAGTPLADPYVRAHARQATIYIGIGILAYALYFALKPYIGFVFFGISLHVIILSLLLTLLIWILIFSAYSAFRGSWEGEIVITNTISLPSELILDETITSEGDKIRLIASFAPLLGIWIASKYPNKYTEIGRRIGTLCFILIVLASYISWSWTGLSLILTLTTIILLSYTGVSIFINQSIPLASIYQWIPSYTMLITHLKSGFLWGGELCWVFFGKEVLTPYRDIFSREYQKIVELPLTTTLPLPSVFIGIPLLNILMIPFLWWDSYHEHRGNILQWILLTLILVCIWWYDGINSEAQYIFFVSALHLMISARKIRDTHAPIVDSILLVSSLFSQTKTTLAKVKEENTSIQYTESDQSNK